MVINTQQHVKLKVLDGIDVMGSPTSRLFAQETLLCSAVWSTHRDWALNASLRKVPAGKVHVISSKGLCRRCRQMAFLCNS